MNAFKFAITIVMILGAGTLAAYEIIDTGQQVIATILVLIYQNVS